jgi:hypothetical protein
MQGLLTDCTTFIDRLYNFYTFFVIGHQKIVESLIARQMFSHQEMYHCCLEPCCGSYMCSLHRINLFLCCTVCPKHQQVRHKKAKVEKDIRYGLSIIL